MLSNTWLCSMKEMNVISRKFGGQEETIGHNFIQNILASNIPHSDISLVK